jgi:hypothetical protein
MAARLGDVTPDAAPEMRLLPAADGMASFFRPSASAAREELRRSLRFNSTVPLDRPAWRVRSSAAAPLRNRMIPPAMHANDSERRSMPGAY